MNANNINDDRSINNFNSAQKSFNNEHARIATDRLSFINRCVANNIGEQRTTSASDENEFVRKDSLWFS